MRHWKNMGRGGRHGSWSRGKWDMPRGFGLDAELAEALGISQEKLQAARETAILSSIQKAVDEGELAPKKAERMQARLKLRSYVDMQALAAQVVDMTPKQFKAALDEGKSPWDLLADKGLDPATAMGKFREAVKATLQQAIADGVVTQEQADDLFRGRGHRGGPFGRRGGFGSMGFLFARQSFGSRWGRGWHGGPYDAGPGETAEPPAVI